ncbi:hypothetical protein [Vibrio penaeicida]|uniref:hypothetical protein n=1 Tax=Vibrio penaeicida TaxID=104609 RepID=UPI000CEA2A0E|nr:hypothetical protein [Vibrio penaeicida]
MSSDEMYYAAFSAALMAGAEPGIAQQLAYQLAYINLSSPHSDPNSVPNIKPTAIEPESEPIKSHSVHSCAIVEPEPLATNAFVRPINPLNHVDWLSGGTLNERGLRLGLRRSSSFSTKSARNTSSFTTKQPFTTKPSFTKKASSDKSTLKVAKAIPRPHKINQAIMLAMMDTDSQAQSKFIAALYFYWKSHQKHSGGNTKSTYWLLMHAIRCYLFGTTFQWKESFAKSIEDRQQNKPMYPTVKELLEHLNFNREESHHLHSLNDQISYYPCNQQIQCIELGLAFRPEIISDFELANATHQQALNLHKMEDAALWAMAS